MVTLYQLTKTTTKTGAYPKISSRCASFGAAFRLRFQLPLLWRRVSGPACVFSSLHFRLRIYASVSNICWSSHLIIAVYLFRSGRSLRFPVSFNHPLKDHFIMFAHHKLVVSIIFQLLSLPNGSLLTGRRL